MMAGGQESRPDAAMRGRRPPAGARNLLKGHLLLLLLSGVGVGVVVVFLIEFGVVVLVVLVEAAGLVGFFF